MRSFPLLLISIFLLFYFLITFGAFKNLIKLTSESFRQSSKWIFWSFNLILLFSFVFLYIYPNQPRHATDYTIYFYFNLILFIDFFSKIPLTLSLLISYLTKRKGNRKTILYSGLIISICLILIMILSTYLGQHKLHVNEVEVEFQNLPESFDNYKIAQISDIHLGSFLKSNQMLNKTQERIEQFQPDLFLFTGDLVNNYSRETIGWNEPFKKMTDKVLSFSILGNHDYGDYTRWKNQEEKQQNLQEIIDAEEKFGFELLRNENVMISNGIDSIFLVGVENWGHPPFPQYADLEKAMKGIPENTFVILMSHDPAHWESKIKDKETIALTLSGHTHGLQWGIKPAGITFSVSYLTRKNWGGIYISEKNILYTNVGLGTIGIPWRIDMPAELTLLTLKRSKI